MNKKLGLFAIVIVAMIVVGLANLVLNFNGPSLQFKNYVEQGDELYDKKIYIDAIDCYDKASEAKPNNIDVRIKLANSYLHLGDTTHYVSTLNSAIDQNNKDETAYLELANYYYTNGDYENAYQILLSASDVTNREKIDELLNELRSYYKITTNVYTDVLDWHFGYLAVNKDGLWGLLNSSCVNAIDCVYDDIGSFDCDDLVTPVSKDNEYYYIDENGYRKLVGDQPYSYLGTFGDGYAPASYNNKFGWIDREFNEYAMEYDYTTSFINGVAAAKKNNKWALIDTKFKTITEFIYDDIIISSNGYVCGGNRVFAKINGKYIMLNKKGKQVGNESFQDAKAFYSDQYAAIKQNDKWGYIDSDGKIVIEPMYDDAKSFRNGVAGIMNNGMWGLIAQDKTIVLKPMFQDIKSMNNEGILIVKNNELWQCIQLIAYKQYEE